MEIFGGRIGKKTSSHYLAGRMKEKMKHYLHSITNKRNKSKSEEEKEK